MGLSSKVALILVIVVNTQITYTLCMPSKQAALNRLKSPKPIYNNPTSTPYTSPNTNKLQQQTKYLKPQNARINQFKTKETMYKTYNFPEIEYPLENSPRDPFYEINYNGDRQLNNPQTRSSYSDNAAAINNLKKDMKMKRRLSRYKQMYIDNSQAERKVSSPLKNYGSNSVYFCKAETFPEVQFPLNAMETWKPTFWNQYEFNNEEHRYGSSVNPTVSNNFQPPNTKLSKLKVKQFLKPYDQLKEEKKRVLTTSSKRSGKEEKGAVYNKTETCERNAEDVMSFGLSNITSDSSYAKNLCSDINTQVTEMYDFENQSVPITYEDINAEVSSINGNGTQTLNCSSTENVDLINKPFIDDIITSTQNNGQLQNNNIEKNKSSPVNNMNDNNSDIEPTENSISLKTLNSVSTLKNSIPEISTSKEELGTELLEYPDKKESDISQQTPANVTDNSTEGNNIVCDNSHKQESVTNTTIKELQTQVPGDTLFEQPLSVEKTEITSTGTGSLNIQIPAQYSDSQSSIFSSGDSNPVLTNGATLSNFNNGPGSSIIIIPLNNGFSQPKSQVIQSAGSPIILYIPSSTPEHSSHTQTVLNNQQLSSNLESMSNIEPSSLLIHTDPETAFNSKIFFPNDNPNIQTINSMNETFPISSVSELSQINTRSDEKSAEIIPYSYSYNFENSPSLKKVTEYDDCARMRNITFPPTSKSDLPIYNFTPNDLTFLNNEPLENILITELPITAREVNIDHFTTDSSKNNSEPKPEDITYQQSTRSSKNFLEETMSYNQTSLSLNTGNTSSFHYSSVNFESLPTTTFDSSENPIFFLNSANKTMTETLANNLEDTPTVSKSLTDNTTDAFTESNRTIDSQVDPLKAAKTASDNNTATLTVSKTPSSVYMDNMHNQKSPIDSQMDTLTVLKALTDSHINTLTVLNALTETHINTLTSLNNQAPVDNHIDSLKIAKDFAGNLVETLVVPETSKDKLADAKTPSGDKSDSCTVTNAPTDNYSDILINPKTQYDSDIRVDTLPVPKTTIDSKINTQAVLKTPTFSNTDILMVPEIRPDASLSASIIPDNYIFENNEKNYLPQPNKTKSNISCDSSLVSKSFYSGGSMICSNTTLPASSVQQSSPKLLVQQTPVTSDRDFPSELPDVALKKSTNVSEITPANVSFQYAIDIVDHSPLQNVQPEILYVPLLDKPESFPSIYPSFNESPFDTSNDTTNRVTVTNSPIAENCSYIEPFLDNDTLIPEPALTEDLQKYNLPPVKVEVKDTSVFDEPLKYILQSEKSVAGDLNSNFQTDGEVFMSEKVQVTKDDMFERKEVNHKDLADVGPSTNPIILSGLSENKAYPSSESTSPNYHLDFEQKTNENLISFCNSVDNVSGDNLSPRDKVGQDILDPSIFAEVLREDVDRERMSTEKLFDQDYVVEKINSTLLPNYNAKDIPSHNEEKKELSPFQLRILKALLENILPHIDKNCTGSNNKDSSTHYYETSPTILENESLSTKNKGEVLSDSDNQTKTQVSIQNPSISLTDCTEVVNLKEENISVTDLARNESTQNDTNNQSKSFEYDVRNVPLMNENQNKLSTYQSKVIKALLENILPKISQITKGSLKSEPNYAKLDNSTPPTGVIETPHFNDDDEKTTAFTANSEVLCKPVPNLPDHKENCDTRRQENITERNIPNNQAIDSNKENDIDYIPVIDKNKTLSTRELTILKAILENLLPNIMKGGLKLGNSISSDSSLNDKVIHESLVSDVTEITDLPLETRNDLSQNITSEEIPGPDNPVDTLPMPLGNMESYFYDLDEDESQEQHFEDISPETEKIEEGAMSEEIFDYSPFAKEMKQDVSIIKDLLEYLLLDITNGGLELNRTGKIRKKRH